MTHRIRSLLPSIGLGLLLLLSASLAEAGGTAAEVRKTVEMTMRVTGHVTIAADGKVASYTLHKPEDLPAPVKNNIAKTLPSWQFEPARPENGAAAARLPMSLSLRATPMQDGNFRLRIVAAHFGDGKQQTPGLRRLSMPPPKYPGKAVAKGYTGVAYILIRVGADGRVAEAAAEQINMFAYGTQFEMEQARDLFAKASLQAAKQWKFEVPAPGKAGAKPFWHVRVPVAFQFTDDKAESYGQWQSYVPGPRSRPGWVEARETAGSPEALASGGIYPLDGSGRKLLTSLGEG